MFDLLTYEKGAAVVRMLEQYLGEEAFRDGVRHYLTTHLYGNTGNEDLWEALEETSGEPVRDLMDSWIFTGGHPLLKGSLEGRQVDLSHSSRSATTVSMTAPGGPFPFRSARAVAANACSCHRQARSWCNWTAPS
jgi:puromycin-sensitive aminopeptidase